ncbi:Crp/Fnr family transcriptional regulator [Dyadobacter chenwenxiniae]|uniref:Crp/Fnr family transcriptional regulator n=1 Tax=Dyadobacter chenwenxiniae TaxID=2906456 RepID=A0A9X1THJ4_9BACT|nr:Crp/Fnr family transcriptional regulator [Dyadobacter chenwenxiniae]MCF0064840.1 Crp/Fnr family transcriptional regulator [Dyadobacter chenwenxiniae]UON82964.1 Crp/Fnr family transcriptional regulator [Dyadobacter chenwenxiniae]
MPKQLLSFLGAMAPLDDTVYSDFLQVLKPVNVPKGKLLLSEGEICDKLWFIKTGLARGCYVTSNSSGKSHEVTEWFASENDFFHAFESFVMQVPSQEFIETLEPCQLIYISRKDLYRLYAKHPEISNVGRIIAERYGLLHKERLREMRLHSAQERLNIFHNQSKELFLRVPQKYIASYLGISENYVSKLRAKH